MKPQSNFKKFLLPLLILVAVIIVGAFLLMKGKTVDQGAALYNAATVTNNGKITNLNATPYPGSTANLLPCSTDNSVSQLQVVSPNGGEVYMPGQLVTIRWATCNISTDSRVTAFLQIYDSNNNSLGSFSAPGMNATVLNHGEEVIRIPTLVSMRASYPSATYGQHFKIWIMSFDPIGSHVSGGDFSDNLFTITTPTTTH